MIILVDFTDKTSTQKGTPLNRANMMAIQGFENVEITFVDGYLVETNTTNGVSRKIKVVPHESITEIIVSSTGTSTKTTRLNNSGFVTTIE